MTQRTRKATNRCRCRNHTGHQCPATATRGSVFCAHHRHCRGSPLSGDEPRFWPERYNDNPLIRRTHNCWSYGMNVVDPAQLTQCNGGTDKDCTLLYHQPGGTKGLSKTLQTTHGRRCRTVKRLIAADVPDARDTDFHTRCAKGTSKIALVVHPGEDYHFYRQDPDGWWSHKDGSNRVKRYDAEGKPIWDPQTASRDYRPRGSFLNYRNFCGYMCVPRRRTIKLSRR